MSQTTIAGRSLQSLEGSYGERLSPSLNSRGQTPCTSAVHSAKVITLPPESLITLDRNKQSSGGMGVVVVRAYRSCGVEEAHGPSMALAAPRCTRRRRSRSVPVAEERGEPRGQRPRPEGGEVVVEVAVRGHEDDGGEALRHHPGFEPGRCAPARGVAVGGDEEAGGAGGAGRRRRGCRRRARRRAGGARPRIRAGPPGRPPGTLRTTPRAGLAQVLRALQHPPSIHSLPNSAYGSCYLPPSGLSPYWKRLPQPDGQPGYVRVDTVHQGDQNAQVRMTPYRSHLISAS